MGGYGVYAVGLHRPDIWAGLTPMAARSDTYLWLKLKKEEIAPWKLPLYEADDPRHLARNALHLPIFMQHGALDNVVPAEHSRLMSADLKALGYPVRYREIENGTHYIYWEAASFHLAYDWMRNLRRAPEPRRVVYTTASLRNNRAYWVEIEAFEDYSKSAHITAEIKGDSIIVDTTNIARFKLNPPRAFVRSKVALVVNRQRLENQVSTQPIVWKKSVTEQTPATFPGIKNPQRSGPIRDCYRDPFLLVYGTQNTTDEVSADKGKALRFADEWQRFADGLPPLKSDKEVTPDDRKKYSLILFGTRDSNSIIAEIADRLPLELTREGYRMGAEKFAGENLGMVLCYPSPFDEKRMVVVHSGEFWGTSLPINHKFDLQPDYLIFGRTFDPTDGTNETRAAGFFDNSWQLPQAKAQTTAQ
jgi:hypothetical protein